MPEGDTLYRLASRLQSLLGGHYVRHFDARDAELRQVALVGQTLVAVESRGKHLLMQFSSGLTLNSHLRMDGRWVFRSGVSAPLAGGKLRAVIGFDCGVLLGYELALLRFVNLSKLPADDLLRRLGPDLLASDFEPEQAVDRLSEWSAAPISVAVMRQSVMAGVGNVFKSEALFLAGINPLVTVGSLSRFQLRALVDVLLPLLQRNAKSHKYGEYRRKTRASIGSGPLLWVYRRAGERCMRCDDVIVMVRQGNPPRSSYYCPTCQPAT